MAGVYLSFSYVVSFCRNKGFMIDIRSSSTMNELFWTILEENIYEEDPNAFPKAISSIKDIREMINIFKILYCFSNSRVLSGGKVGRPDIDIFKHWRKIHLSQGREPGEEMQHIDYAEQEVMEKYFWRYMISS